MATTNALAAVCEAIRDLLEAAFTEDKIADPSLQGISTDFEVFNAEKFSTAAIKSRVTVFMVRALPNLAHRTPPGRILPDGRRQRTRLPLDLDVLITVWGSDPTTQNRLTGWVLRTLEDYPSLPASLLNHAIPNTFAPDEDVQLVLNEMSQSDLLDLWEKLTDEGKPYQLCIPYAARAVAVESRRIDPAGAPVQERRFEWSAEVER